MHQAAQKRAGREDDASALKATSVLKPHAADDRAAGARRDLDRFDRALEQGQVRRGLEHRLHGGGVSLAVTLGAGRPDGRPLAAIQQSELDASGVGGQPHQPAEGVDLADHLTLADTADRGVATHPADGGAVHGDQGRRHSHPRSRPRRLGSGVTAPDDDDLETLRHGGV